MGLSLDAGGGVGAPGANVQQYTPNEWGAQRWTLQDVGGGYYIRNASGLHLDFDNGKSKDGSNVLGFSFSGADDQKWKLTALTSLSASTVAAPDQTYTGKALTPAPTVKVSASTTMRPVSTGIVLFAECSSNTRNETHRVIVW